MSYPNYFTPRGWREAEGDPERLKASFLDGCSNQTPEVSDQWQVICDKIIAIVDLFNEMVTSDVGNTQLTVQANTELDEHEMYLNFRLIQRTYGTPTRGTTPNKWPEIVNLVTDIAALFASMVGADEGEVHDELSSNVTPGAMLLKYYIIQKADPEAVVGEAASGHRKKGPLLRSRHAR